MKTPDPWRPISTYRRKGRIHHEVDLWLVIHASPLSMGLADDFRVVDAFQKEDGTWWHFDLPSYKDKQIVTEYVTHWMPRPKTPRKTNR